MEDHRTTPPEGHARNTISCTPSLYCKKKKIKIWYSGPKGGGSGIKSLIWRGLKLGLPRRGGVRKMSLHGLYVLPGPKGRTHLPTHARWVRGTGGIIGSRRLPAVLIFSLRRINRRGLQIIPNWPCGSLRGSYACLSSPLCVPIITQPYTVLLAEPITQRGRSEAACPEPASVVRPLLRTPTARAARRCRGRQTSCPTGTTPAPRTSGATRCGYTSPE